MLAGSLTASARVNHKVEALAEKGRMVADPAGVNPVGTAEIRLTEKEAGSGGTTVIPVYVYQGGEDWLYYEKK